MLRCSAKKLGFKAAFQFFADRASILKIREDFKAKINLQKAVKIIEK
jgi:hypothetical protein